MSNAVPDQAARQAPGALENDTQDRGAREASVADHTPRLLLCSCAGTMDVASPALEVPFAGHVQCTRYSGLCTHQAPQFLRALEGGGPVTVACAQEAPGLLEMAQEAGVADPEHLTFVDIRDRAGWSSEAHEAAPKMAALLAESRLSPPDTPVRELTSDGVCLVYGAGQQTLETAAALNEQLSVSCLLTGNTDDLIFPPVREFPILTGTLRSVAGHLGAFEVVVDGFAALEPAGRGAPTFGDRQNGAKSGCDVLVDISGGQALVSAPHKRDGYVRADPGDPAAVASAVRVAADLVGTFERPLYIRFEPTLCAHQRASITGCTRCLSVCPTGAIQPPAGRAGEAVLLDPDICAGCGSCAAICPSGAASADHPTLGFQLERLRTLVSAYRAAGASSAPHLLIHDVDHGAPLISIAARYGDGLPFDVIPFALDNLGTAGHTMLIAAIATGFAGVTVLPGPRTEMASLQVQIDLANALLRGTGRPADPVMVLEARDPDDLNAALYGREDDPADGLRADPVLLLGEGRQVLRTALNALTGQTLSDKGTETVPPIPLPQGSPYGAIHIDKDACTLCLSCVSLCPSGALIDNPDRPEVRFQEDACLQCGICKAACPETAITNEPRYNLNRAALTHRELHGEDPFECISCGKPFGVASTINRIIEKLSGNHWMFQQSDNAKLIQMCDDCRVQAQFHGDGAPMQMGTPRRVRTTEDYLAGVVDDSDETPDGQGGQGGHGGQSGGRLN